jgi:hypothetical protein
VPKGFKKLLIPVVVIVGSGWFCTFTDVLHAGEILAFRAPGTKRAALPITALFIGSYRRRPMKAIAGACPCLVYFAVLVLAPLSKPRHQHLVRLADAGCIAIPSPTLGALQCPFLDAPDPSNYADVLRTSRWSEAELRTALVVSGGFAERRRSTS